ncbi:hypothetical protein KP509_02G053900 [Ceratopteris richardii]|uniref:BHLH domain-containing protein n=1 Tax=Ceratopteris richardii TaxID=49495 RepID=A0A8T2V5Z6_CERRI|nr:hypothetical protein KP509_02G053900 [Ceratopteris richardii]
MEAGQEKAGISQCPGSGSFLEITEQKDALVVADLPQTASNTCVSPFLQDWSFNAEVECNIVCGDDSIGKTQSDKASSNYLDESVNTEQVPCQLVEARDWAQSGCGGSGDGKSCKGRHANGEGLMNMVSSVYDTKQDLDNENLPKEKSPTKLNDQKRRRVWPFTTSMSSNTETVNFGSNMNDVQVNQSSVCSYRDGSNAEAVRDPSIFHCGIHALDKVRKKDCVSKDNSISDMGDVLCRGMQHRRSSELLNQQSPFPSASETTMNDKAPWGDIKVQNSIPELKRLSPASKNISSERRRRLKLNEKLYCLRALVPSISKMDKASILADAVQYVRELKQKVDNMEEEIASLEEYKMKIVRTPQRHHAAMDGSRKRYAQFSTKSRNLAHHIVHESLLQLHRCHANIIRKYHEGWKFGRSRSTP